MCLFFTRLILVILIALELVSNRDCCKFWFPMKMAAFFLIMLQPGFQLG